MSLNLVPAGKSLPDDIYVIIEIPQNADPIKYEVDKDSGAIFVDRFMSTPMFYPCNYGYVNATLSLMVIRSTCWCRLPTRCWPAPSFAAARLAC